MARVVRRTVRRVARRSVRNRFVISVTERVWFTKVEHEAVTSAAKANDVSIEMYVRESVRMRLGSHLERLEMNWIENEEDLPIDEVSSLTSAKQDTTVRDIWQLMVQGTSREQDKPSTHELGRIGRALKELGWKRYRSTHEIGRPERWRKLMTTSAGFKKTLVSRNESDSDDQSAEPAAATPPSTAEQRARRAADAYRIPPDQVAAEGYQSGEPEDGNMYWCFYCKNWMRKHQPCVQGNHMFFGFRQYVVPSEEVYVDQAKGTRTPVDMSGKPGHGLPPAPVR